MMTTMGMAGQVCHKPGFVLALVIFLPRSYGPPVSVASPEGPSVDCASFHALMVHRRNDS